MDISVLSSFEISKFPRDLLVIIKIIPISDMGNPWQNEKRIQVKFSRSERSKYERNVLNKKKTPINFIASDTISLFDIFISPMIVIMIKL